VSGGERKKKGRRSDGGNIKRRRWFISELAGGPSSFALMGEFGSVDAGISSWKSLPAPYFTYDRARFTFYTHTYTHSLEEEKEDMGGGGKKTTDKWKEKRTQTFFWGGLMGREEGKNIKANKRIWVFCLSFLCVSVLFSLLFSARVFTTR
jgi:hypothetical protein